MQSPVCKPRRRRLQVWAICCIVVLLHTWALSLYWVLALDVNAKNNNRVGLRIFFLVDSSCVRLGMNCESWNGFPTVASSIEPSSLRAAIAGDYDLWDRLWMLGWLLPRIRYSSVSRQLYALVPIWALIAPFVVILALRRREYSANVGHPRCPSCDYDLNGTMEPRCPECGLAFDKRDMDTQAMVNRRP